ncbi:hypothetical protein ABZ707_30260 [Streptomyces sp. NPDC006923]|uniref:hypothetical protein n=1 Tax=Streptomyces sp. NPDC006923 TaxID=3155355 RepID=UPI0033FA22E0
MPDDDVLAVVTELIESHFQMSLSDLRRAVTAAPQANSQATAAVHWHGLLAESEEALARAEDDLMTVLMVKAPGEVDEPPFDFAHRVNLAVTVRDGRVTVIRHLLDTPAPAGYVWSGSSPEAGRAPALQTRPPARPMTSAAPAQGVTR